MEKKYISIDQLWKCETCFYMGNICPYGIGVAANFVLVVAALIVAKQ